MSKQQTFGEEAAPEVARVYFRPIKIDARGIPKPDETTVPQTAEVEDLLEYIKDKKLKYPTSLDEANMGEVAYDSASDIIENGPNTNTNVKLFLANFCDSLQSKQRTKDKYAMLVCYCSDFLLAHVKTERGMSIQEESGDVELVRRFLDVDNILSAAYFEDLGPEIKFSHFTDTDSGSFRNFLGVSQKRFNYRRKSVQIICHYEGKSGVECKFEFGNDQMEERWLQQESLRFQNGKLDLSNGRSHNIKEIRWGRSTYEVPQSFMSEFKEYSYELDGQGRRYNDLRRLPGEEVASIYGDGIDIVDRKTEVIIEDDEGQRDIRPKGELPDHIHVMYANNTIRLGANFAEDIFHDLIDTTDFSLYHPSEPFASNEYVLNGLSLLNIDIEEIAPERAQLLNTIHDHLDNATGQTLRRCLGFVFLHALADSECVSIGYKNGLNQLINLNHGATRQHDVVTTKEQEGDGLIEYKDKDDLGKEDTATSIVDNIEKESRNHDEKVFLWGIDEGSRRVDGLRKGRWGDDRVSSIQKHVLDRLEERDMNYTDFELVNLPIGENQERCILVGILY
ncbi:hypothetical protein [Halovivax gelatinilyticus]|uniref:hypothetical protein n=1 Tax=Halovivax gelatinilyticus TaxID=2961597 RepID=UPI0020CA6C10|nr:hypothetical protein [Halovivax gelatinilyticus]